MSQATYEALAPAELVAGDTWVIADGASEAAWPAPDWQVSWVIRPEGGGAPVSAVVSGAEVVFAASATAAVPAGPAQWVVVAEGQGGTPAAGQRETLAHGRLSVRADPLAGAYVQSDAERILAAIQATIEGRASRDADSYTIEGRSLARTPVADLLRLRGVYARLVAEEKGQGGGVAYRRVDFC